MPTANLPGIPAGKRQRKAHTLPQYSNSRLLEKNAGESKWLEDWRKIQQRNGDYVQNNIAGLGLPMTEKEKGQCFCPVWMIGDIRVAR